MYRRQKHCRWCGNAYIALKPISRDGFCKPSCKQAHYRAYKNYVPARGRRIARPQVSAVTPKKGKKSCRKDAKKQS